MAREIEILKELPDHSNIAQFFHAEMVCNKFILIYLEFCHFTLGDHVEDNNYPLGKYDISKQITVGLGFLHENNIIHSHANL